MDGNTWIGFLAIMAREMHEGKKEMLPPREIY